MKKSELTITFMLFFLTATISLWLPITGEGGVMYRVIIFIVVCSIMIIAYIILVTYFCEPEEKLEFTLIHKPGNIIELKDIRTKGKTKLVWHFKNNIRKKVTFFYYIIFTTWGEEVVYSNHPKDDWSFTMPPKGEKPWKWNPTDPMGYGIGSKGRGRYEINCIVKYKFEGGEQGFVYDGQEVKVI